MSSWLFFPLGTRVYYCEVRQECLKGSFSPQQGNVGSGPHGWFSRKGKAWALLEGCSRPVDSSNWSFRSKPQNACPEHRLRTPHYQQILIHLIRREDGLNFNFYSLWKKNYLLHIGSIMNHIYLLTEDQNENSLSAPQSLSHPCTMHYVGGGRDLSRKRVAV